MFGGITGKTEIRLTFELPQATIEWLAEQQLKYNDKKIEDSAARAFVEMCPVSYSGWRHPVYAFHSVKYRARILFGLIGVRERLARIDLCDAVYRAAVDRRAL